ncbi:hypothetical protein PR202_ga12103 [Eleusine coracana subsp. coracana]|uniref:Uncharacterized protein n=1 Tax=Eleusine coracana subsp. coracana TaxID=191504 RepID=A0AAV5CB87_ELECO|nr:hypothetical protein PR202_ga12103 [Eleusine coracana subsp. coracana]
MAPNSPLALLLGALLLAASVMSSPVVAGDNYGGGRMVTVHAARTAAPSSAMLWQRRRLEDEVAPEFPSAAVRGGGIGYDTFNPNKQVCINDCAAKGPGSSYTRARACTYQQRCPQGRSS